MVISYFERCAFKRTGMSALQSFPVRFRIILTAHKIDHAEGVFHDALGQLHRAEPQDE